MSNGTENAILEALLQGPALAPPPGQTVNFNDPPSLFGVDLAIAISSMVVATTLTALRMYTKVFIVRNITIDDCLLLGAWTLYMIYTAFTLVVACSGVGRHQWDVRLENIPRMLYYFRLACLTYGLVSMMLKSSILMQLLKIFNPPKRRGPFFWASHITNAMVIVFYVICSFIEIFACSPIRKFWTPWIPGHCFNMFAVSVAAGAVNSFVDIMILILPIGSIWELRMPLKKKLQTSSIFALGLFALAASIVRLCYAIDLLHSKDVTWRISKMGLWSFGEISMLFICACMPSLAGLVRHCSTKFVRRGRDLSSDKEMACRKPQRRSYRTPYSVGLSTMDHE